MRQVRRQNTKPEIAQEKRNRQMDRGSLGGEKGCQEQLDIWIFLKHELGAQQQMFHLMQ